MLRKLYDWTLQKSATPAAEVWLALIAFVESSVFANSRYVLFVPMALAKPAKAYRYALVATLASTLGGIAGYFIGHYAYQEVAKPVLAFYNKLHLFEQLRSSAGKDAILLMLVTSGVAHLPPIKVVTILSGAAGIQLMAILSSPVSQPAAPRFLALAWAFARYGETVRNFYRTPACSYCRSNCLCRIGRVLRRSLHLRALYLAQSSCSKIKLKPSLEFPRFASEVPKSMCEFRILAATPSHIKQSLVHVP